MEVIGIVVMLMFIGIAQFCFFKSVQAQLYAMERKLDGINEGACHEQAKEEPQQKPDIVHYRMHPGLGGLIPCGFDATKATRSFAEVTCPECLKWIKGDTTDR